MRKIIAATAPCILGITLGAAAQNIYPTSGNVGIGTTAPDQALTVQGIVHELPAAGWGGSNTANFYLGDSNNGVFAQFGGFTGLFGYNGVQLIQRGNAGLTLINGNVGIGTTSPRTGLEVDTLDTDYPSSTTTSIRVGGINTGSSGVAINGTSSTNQILFSSYRDIQPDTVGAKIAGINNAVYSPGGAGNYWRIQNTDIAFSTLSTTPSSADSTTEKMRLTAAGNLGIGTATPGAKLEVDGNVKLTSGSGASITFADGTVQSTAYTGVTCGGDYAESIDAMGGRMEYAPGDLLVIDPKDPGRFLKSTTPYSTLVAGIYSTKPGTVGRRETTYAKVDTTAVPMAMMGIVPTKVSAENGPIETGDLLVTSSTVGYAMKGTDRDRLTGAVVGKALASLDSGKGVIEVLVTLQ
jgi:hypothetical protein